MGMGLLDKGRGGGRDRPIKSLHNLDPWGKTDRGRGALGHCDLGRGDVCSMVSTARGNTVFDLDVSKGRTLLSLYMGRGRTLFDMGLSQGHIRLVL